MVLFWMSASILKGDSDPEDSLREFILQSPALNHELTEADRTALLSIQAVTKVHRQRSRHV